MAASRSMLESLLARVRQRATQPRAPSLVIRPLNTPKIGVSAASRPPVAQKSTAEDEIEEYEDELVEIIDDSELVTHAPPEVRPLGLSVSAPSVEMRRRIVPPSTRPVQPAALPALPKAPPAIPSPVIRNGAAKSIPVSSPAAEGVRAELVSRRPLAVADVVQSQGARRDLRTVSFVELLDASLKLGG